MSATTDARIAYGNYAQVARMNNITPTPFDIWLHRQQDRGLHLQAVAIEGAYCSSAGRSVCKSCPRWGCPASPNR